MKSSKLYTYYTVSKNNEFEFEFPASSCPLKLRFLYNRYEDYHFELLVHDNMFNFIDSNDSTNTIIKYKIIGLDTEFPIDWYYVDSFNTDNNLTFFVVAKAKNENSGVILNKN